MWEGYLGFDPSASCVGDSGDAWSRELAGIGIPSLTKIEWASWQVVSTSEKLDVHLSKCQMSSVVRDTAATCKRSPEVTVGTVARA